MDAAPRFTIEGQPDLENALNLLGQLINNNINKKIEPTWPIAVDEDKESVSITFEGDLSEVVSQAIAQAPKLLCLTDQKPDYIPELDLEGADVLAEGALRCWVYYGAVNDIPLNDSDYLNYTDVTETTYFYAKVDLDPSADGLHVLEVSVVSATDTTTYNNPMLNLGDPRPNEWYLLVGTAFKVTESNGDIRWVVTDNGAGSVVMSEHIARIARGTGNTTEVAKNISYVRLRS